MKKFEDLDEGLRKELKQIVLSDRFGLKADTLYKNIFNSTGPITTLAQIFEVKASVVRKIKAS